MQRDAHRIAQPDGPSHDEGRVEGEEGVGDVAAGRAVDYEAAQAGQQKPEERDATPLPGGDPHLAGQADHRGDPEVRGVEDVPAVDAEDELAGDGQHTRGHRQRQAARPKQQAERQARKRALLGS